MLSSFGHFGRDVLTKTCRLRTHGAGFAPPRDEPRSVEPYLTPPVEDMAKPTPAAAVNDRNVEEMQASLILTSLRTAPTDGLEQLTSALLVGDLDALHSTRSQLTPSRPLLTPMSSRSLPRAMRITLPGIIWSTRTRSACVPSLPSWRR